MDTTLITRVLSELLPELCGKLSWDTSLLLLERHVRALSFSLLQDLWHRHGATLQNSEALKA